MFAVPKRSVLWASLSGRSRYEHGVKSLYLLRRDFGHCGVRGGFADNGLAVGEGGEQGGDGEIVDGVGVAEAGLYIRVMWDRPRARSRDSARPVSLGRPPAPECPSPGIRRSTNPPGAVSSRVLGQGGSLHPGSGSAWCAPCWG
jgi:hypothetical protein